jgi:toxin ParE1/3/4
LTYRLSASAGADFEQIARATEERWGADQARSYGEALIACFEAMAAGSVRNRSIVIAGRTFWRHRCRHHNIIAIQTEAGLLILAILHERMEIAARIDALGSPG